MGERLVCEPSNPHSSDSTDGQEHVDFQHKIYYDNGTVRNDGVCEGNQHVDGGWVEAFKTLLK